MTNNPQEPNAPSEPPPSEEGGTSPEGVSPPSLDTPAEPELVADRQQRRDERWRERATTAEATVERLVRGEVIRQLAGRVSDPAAALQLGDVQLAELLGDDGDVDSSQVEALAHDLVGKYPSLQPRTHHGDIGQKASAQQGKASSWAEVLRKK